MVLVSFVFSSNKMHYLLKHCTLFVFSSLFCVHDFHPIIFPILWKYTYDPGIVRVSHPRSSSTRIVVLVLVSHRVCKSAQRAKVCCAFFVWQSRAFALQIRSWCFFLLCLCFPVIAASRGVSEILLLFLFLHFLAAFGVWTGKEKARSVSSRSRDREAELLLLISFSFMIEGGFLW
jgi:hypothetical protein